EPHRLPSPHPARRRGCQDAIPDPRAHASPCLRLQARQRWPRHAGPAALPRAQEHPAYGPVQNTAPPRLQTTINFPAYPKEHVRFKCNDHKVRGIQLNYKSADKYVGDDTLDLLVPLARREPLWKFVTT